VLQGKDTGCKAAASSQNDRIVMALHISKPSAMPITLITSASITLWRLGHLFAGGNDDGNQVIIIKRAIPQ